MTKMSVLVICLAASFIGCATEEADPAEGSVLSAVSENADNYVLTCSTNGLALRAFDDPNATPIGAFSYGALVHVGQVDWHTRMANITSPSHGWMRIDGANGPLLSVNLTSCN
jgi:hypothetical protein